MGMMKSFKQGEVIAARRSRLILYLWLANLAFAFLVVAPFAFLIGGDFSRSLLGERLARGVDFLWLGDVILKYQDALAGLSGWVLIPVVLYFLWSVFSSGGILGRITSKQDERTTLAGFLSDGCRYFFRFFRVFLLSIPVYLLVLGLVYRLIGTLFDSWSKNARTEWGAFWASNLKLLVFLLLFSLVRMLFDYVKIRLVVEQSRKAFRATVLTFGFLVRRLARAWGLYLLIGVLSLAVSFLFLGVSRLLAGGFGAILLIVWEQIYMAVRQGFKVWFLSSEYHFYWDSVR